MHKALRMVGGPLDGMTVPNPGYFADGDIEEVNTRDLSQTDPQWSPLSVYVVRGARLVYDARATTQRRLQAK